MINIKQISQDITDLENIDDDSEESNNNLNKDSLIKKNIKEIESIEPLAAKEIEYSKKTKVEKIIKHSTYIFKKALIWTMCLTIAYIFLTNFKVINNSRDVIMIIGFLSYMCFLMIEVLPIITYNLTDSKILIKDSVQSNIEQLVTNILDNVRVSSTYSEDCSTLSLTIEKKSKKFTRQIKKSYY